MASALQTAPISRKRMWTGRILSGLAALLLLGHGVAKLFKPAPVREAFARLGYPESEIGDPLFSHVLFPTYVGALLWGGLCLREERLRGLIPLRRTR